jgi:cell shape-determining protein MreC
VASELSWIFPKGLPIGVVEQVHERESGLAPYGTLRPFVDLARLEWVMVVLAEPIEAPWWEETP